LLKLHNIGVTCFASLLSLGIATAFCGIAFAKQPDPKSGLIEFYLQAAFANQERVLKRFATKDRFEVSVGCLDHCRTGHP
jgi:hypothetical protein